MDKIIRIAAALTILAGLATLNCGSCCFSRCTITPDSSAIQTFHYEERREELLITFSDGSSYLHKNVPKKAFFSLQNAPSTGVFYNENIKGQFPSEKQ